MVAQGTRNTDGLDGLPCLHERELVYDIAGMRAWFRPILSGCTHPMVPATAEATGIYRVVQTSDNLI
jgi:hypothetical protein